MRACAICGESLEGLRPQARFCSAGCRTEAWRIRRLVEGVPVGRYRNLVERLAAYGRPRSKPSHKASRA